MAGKQAFTQALGEARSRVFARGFDLSFRIVLAVAYVAGALFLAQRGGGLTVGAILAGLVSMALFLAMPLVMIFVYVTAISFLARITGVPDEADPSLREVALAFVFTLCFAVAFVGGISKLPVVGAQLRAIFS